MQRSKFFPLQRGVAALTLALAAACAHGVELGDPVVHSYLGQPLAADIELAMGPDDKGAVQARLASLEVYRVANLSLYPPLQSLRMTVVKRDGKQFLHLTSFRPIAVDHVSFFIELWSGNRSEVRALTLFFTADPNPVPPPPPAPPPPPPVPVMAAPVHEPEAPLERMPAHVPAVAPRAMPAPASAAPVTMAAATSEPAPAMHAAPKTAAPALAEAHVAPEPAAARAIPTHPGAGRAGAAAACSPQLSGPEAQACIALDRKNAALTKKLTALEEKVRQLQQVLEPSSDAKPELALKPEGGKLEGGKPEGDKAPEPKADAAKGEGAAEHHAAEAKPEPAAAAHGAEAAAAPAAEAKAAEPAPAPKAKLRPLVPLKAKAPAAGEKPPEGGMSGTTWFAGAAGLLLLLIGVGVHFFLRAKRRKKAAAGEPGKTEPAVPAVVE